MGTICQFYFNGYRVSTNQPQMIVFSYVWGSQDKTDQQTSFMSRSSKELQRSRNHFLPSGMPWSCSANLLSHGLIFTCSLKYLTSWIGMGDIISWLIRRYLCWILRTVCKKKLFKFRISFQFYLLFFLQNQPEHINS